MGQKMLIFHNSPLQIMIVTKRLRYFLYFIIIKTNSLRSLNDGNDKQQPLFSDIPEYDTHRFRVQVLQNPPFCSSTFVTGQAMQICSTFALSHIGIFSFEDGRKYALLKVTCIHSILIVFTILLSLL
jgi:hypothetical protein